MKVNTDINILGGLPDWDLIKVFLKLGSKPENEVNEANHYGYTSIKTDEAVSRFKRAILETIIHFKNEKVETLCRSIISSEGVSKDGLLFLFWNSSFNNDLLGYLNDNVFFPALFGGRATIAANEVAACLKDMDNPKVSSWADYTLKKVSSKYLTLLKKFGLMEGGIKKTLVNIYLNDKLFVLFIYWLISVEGKPNLLLSSWLKYSFSEKSYFLDRLLQKKYSRFFNLYYTGDVLRIEPLFEYNQIYHELTSS
jgi:hypothetical protein